MRKIETLVRNTTQLNLQEILNNKFYHNKYGWIKTGMSQKERERAINMAVDVIGGRRKESIRGKLTYASPNHWALRRIFFNIGIYDGKLRCTYCAGQDYPYELNQLRKYLYSL
jgi:hypothetical protein